MYSDTTILHQINNKKRTLLYKEIQHTIQLYLVLRLYIYYFRKSQSSPAKSSHYQNSAGLQNCLPSSSMMYDTGPVHCTTFALFHSLTPHLVSPKLLCQPKNSLHLDFLLLYIYIHTCFIKASSM